MDNSTTCNPENPHINRVYGFMDPNSNTFYAFEDLEQYQLFLLWIQTQQPNQNVIDGQEAPN